jgi:recombinational DNA repair protein (RecF pathway)
MRVFRVGLLSVMLHSCAATATPVQPVSRDTYIVPLSVHDEDRICVEVWDQPRRRCVTVGEVRDLANTVKAEP